jgi:hypothetical protein
VEIDQSAMQRIRAKWLFGLGLGLVVTGFVYDVVFAGIPYQDPTPAMQRDYLRQAHIASNATKLGIVLVCLGFVLFLIRRSGRSKSAGHS